MNLKYTLAVLLLVSSASTVVAQTTDSQKFTVTIPSAFTIVAPINAQITHDESENDQLFPSQPWVVTGNVSAGVSVSISTDDVFVHTVDSSAKRDATLDLAVNSSVGAAAWTVTQASDTTDYASGDGVATVQASSDGFGQATLDVNVGFITDNFGTFPAGDYETTVVGTVTAN